jgi:hypothetical protein
LRINPPLFYLQIPKTNQPSGQNIFRQRSRKPFYLLADFFFAAGLFDLTPVFLVVFFAAVFTVFFTALEGVLFPDGAAVSSVPQQ